MRFIEFTGLLLFINLTLSLFAQIGVYAVMDNQDKIDAPDSYTESVDDMGQLNDETDSVRSKLEKWNDDKDYVSPGAQSSTAQYLQSGGDFIMAWRVFTDVFLGTMLMKPTLDTLGVPDEIAWYFVVPYSFLYVLAVVEFFSGRQVENK